MKSLSPESTTHSNNRELIVSTSSKLHVFVEHIPKSITLILQQFDKIFVEPNGLPPMRGNEYFIRLKPETGDISVRPYIYPQGSNENIGG